MSIDTIIQSSKDIGNSHTITKTVNNQLEIKVASSNRIKLIVIGFLFVIVPTLLKYFIPTVTQDNEFFFKVQLICYAMPILLFIVGILQNDKTIIDINSKTITNKKQIIKAQDIEDIAIEQFKKRQHHQYSIYLTSKTNQKILIGATTNAGINQSALQHYAQTMLNFVKSL